MRLVTAEQSQLIDQLAKSDFGLTSEKLMESAGSAVAEEIHLIIKDKKKKILVLIGPGNNGADGFVVARVLKRKGFTEIQCVTLLGGSGALWQMQKSRAQEVEIKVNEFSDSRLQMAIGESDIIVDAIFGTGFKRKLSSELAELFYYINSKKKIVVAVDSPSGLDVDTGRPQPDAIRANLTVTFGLSKPGFYISKGPQYSGRVKVNNIGFPKKLLFENSSTHFAFGAKAAARTLPRRELDQNKSDFGTVQIFAGSEKYPGAGVLCANASGRMGAGYVHLNSFININEQILQIPEVIVRAADDYDFKELNSLHAFVVGPGLGVGEKTKKIILELKKRKASRVLLDADALTVCAAENLWPLPETWIFTPHAGELSRIIGLNTKKIEEDRFAALKLATEKTGCIVLLKGSHSIVSTSQKSSAKNIVIFAGNVALAKAGSGDVLSGFIGALMAQNLEPMTAASLGAYVHGRLSDEWIKKGNDVITLLPSDLTRNVPELVKKIREGL